MIETHALAGRRLRVRRCRIIRGGTRAERSRSRSSTSRATAAPTTSPSKPATGRVFVSRGTHMMVVDGATGKVVGDIPDTPGVHGAGIATKAGHGFTTNGGNSTVTMFDLKTLAVIKQIKVEQGGLDGIMYDEPDDKIILTNHSRPIGTLDRARSEDRRHRRDRRARGHGARRRRRRRQGTHLRQQREQEHDPGDRRQDVEGDGVVAARAVRGADRDRVRQGDQPHLLRLQQDLGRASTRRTARSSRRSRTARASMRWDGIRRRS